MFNKNYRYNYKFNNSTIVTNVLFADTVKQSGADTVYCLNRIGVQCISNCLYDTMPNSQHPFYYGNMPQFLQRNIVKYANGTVMLYDTTKIFIIPTCTLNQTWLCDSIYNYPAACINITTQQIFGTLDSVKTLLINYTDTVKLSKTFGLIVFPQPYLKNKYYRLSGIEKKNSYDQTALYGQKVPNAWDFYDYSIGDIQTSVAYSTSGWSPTTINIKQKTITAKNVLPTGYSYSFTEHYFSQTFPINMHFCTPPNISAFVTNTYTTNFSNLSDPTLLENRIYPKMVFIPSSPGASVNIVNSMSSFYIPNITNFGVDNNGRFYKYMGQLCTYANPILPNSGALKGLDIVSPGYYKLSSFEYTKLCFGEDFGLIQNSYYYFEGGPDFHLTNVIKNGTSYFGPANTVGMEEKITENSETFFYPNPASFKIYANINEASRITIIDSFGKEILTASMAKGQTIDVSEFPNGVYFIRLLNNDYLKVQKLIVQH